MKTTDIIRRAGRSIRQAKTRTLLTSLAIGVGAFTITLSLAGGQGGREYADAIVKANTNVKELTVTQKQADTATIQEYTEGRSAASAEAFGPSLDPITFTDIEAMQKIDGVASVTPNYSPSVNYITTQGQKKYVASVSTFSPSVTVEFAAGSANGGLKNDQIILTEAYAKVLGFTNPADAIGKTVTINASKLASSFLLKPESKDFTFTVAGVSSASGLAFRSQGSLLITDATAKDIYTYVNEGTSAYGNFMIASVIVDDVADVKPVQTALQDQNYEAQTAEDILGTVNTFINVLLGVLLGFGALAVLTSVFGIVNTQYISVLERTQQIGLMKALGMSQGDVGKLFTFEAAWIGFLGGAIGAGLAVLAGTLANPAISDALGLDDISLLIFVPTQVIGVIVVLIAISIIAGLLPARKASKLDPIEALRTE